MNLESCPVFMMNGDEIVDVFYALFEERPDGNWQSAGVTTFTATGPSTHTVIETPLGCFQWDAPVRPGYTVNISNGSGGYSLRPCQRVLSHVAQV